MLSMSDTRRAPDFERHPALWLAVALAFGITAGAYIDISFAIPTAAAAILAAFALVLRSSLTSALLILAAFIAAGSALYQTEQAGIGETQIRSIYDSGVIR